MTNLNSNIATTDESPTLVIVPGLGGSGEDHWQSIWHREYKRSVQITQDDWDQPYLNVWLHTLTDAVSLLHKPFLFVAHSLGVSLVAHWASRYGNKYAKGAFLVAPADVDSASRTPDVVRSFAPMPLSALPFPSLVVAGENDPYVSIDRAHFFADQWGSQFADVGAEGHINAKSGLGNWQEGKTLLQQLQKQIAGRA